MIIFYPQPKPVPLFEVVREKLRKRALQGRVIYGYEKYFFVALMLIFE
jgi:hypothetical protein